MQLFVPNKGERTITNDSTKNGPGLEPEPEEEYKIDGYIHAISTKEKSLNYNELKHQNYLNMMN